MTGPPDLLERLDAFLNRAVLELRAELAGARATDDERGTHAVSTPADDLADGNLLDTTSAQERFGYPRNTLAKWCRTEDLGVLRGGRWLVSVPRLQRRLNGS
jgi:hypothetical protein